MYQALHQVLVRNQGEENIKMSDWCPLELRSLRSGEEERQEPEYIREEFCEKCHANSKEEMTTHV